MENGASPALVLRDQDLVFLREIEKRLPRLELPLAPRRDHRDVRVQRVIAQFKANLIVALARCAVANCIRACFVRDLDLAFGDKRPGD